MEQPRPEVKQAVQTQQAPKPLSLVLEASTNVQSDQPEQIKLEQGYEKLQASSNAESLLKKHLTRPVFEKLRHLKTNSGASLLDVVQSGFANEDSHVGVYAPDAQAYTVFGDLFDPIVSDCHPGFQLGQSQPARDWGSLDAFTDLDPSGEFVLSTRVRCARSIEGYPLPAGMTKEHYQRLEHDVGQTLGGLEGEMAGKYLPLTEMSDSEQKRLIDEHFLFKSGDPYLEAANACRFWPTGRGIYLNSDRTFLVWINEEDHLRIISMQKGGDLRQVYSRLVTAAEEIDARLPFSRHERFGYITSCPSNLGTTIRASVHIRLPKLGAVKSKLTEVAARYSLQVRGTSGEKTEAVGGVYDISNNRRLGVTEYQIMLEMQTGIMELIKIEKSM